VDDSQVVLVTGEQDNTFTPGGGATPVNAWDGLSLEGTLGRGEERRFETPALPAGSYVFEMEGTGDADLYVRVGLQPDLQSFDCRPYKSGTRESCKLELSAPAPIFGLIQGYRDATFTLSAKAN
jgi:leucyl aminopeptidase